MSLDYDLTACDPGQYREGDDWHPWVQSVIFSTMAVGIGHLTEDTLPEFIARDNIWALIHGFDPTPTEYIRAMIGMRTNVGYEAKATWLRRVVGRHYDEVMNGIKAG